MYFGDEVQVATLHTHAPTARFWRLPLAAASCQSHSNASFKIRSLESMMSTLTHPIHVPTRRRRVGLKKSCFARPRRLGTPRGRRRSGGGSSRCSFYCGRASVALGEGLVETRPTLRSSCSRNLRRSNKAGEIVGQSLQSQSLRRSSRDCWINLFVLSTSLEECGSLGNVKFHSD